MDLINSEVVRQLIMSSDNGASSFVTELTSNEDSANVEMENAK